MLKHISMTISALLIAVFICIQPAIAADTVTDVRIWPSPDSTRVVLDMSGSAKYSYFTLKNPERLVIDLQDTKLSKNLNKLDIDSKLLKKVRKSTPKKKGDVRLVLDLTKSIKPVIFDLPPAGPYGDRLVIDLIDTKTKVAKSEKKVGSNRDVVIAIDAGHGGEDPGSIGPSGKYEKHITLSVAKKIAALINKQKGMKAFLTRTGDYSMDLHARTRAADRAGADLFISVHADAFTSPGPSGASVWLQSTTRATTEVGRIFEDQERQSEVLAGVAQSIQEAGASNDQYLKYAFIDMRMEHSRDQGYYVAKEVLSELQHITKLHQHKPQSMSLGVLKSPNYPSILVETGFISNPKEEKLLTNAWQQNRLAKSIVQAVKKYFDRYPPDGTYYAMKKKSTIKHRVRRGESLSLVAQNYNVSISSIKTANNLKSDTIRVGQLLSIPQ